MQRLDGIFRRIGAMGITATERHWALIPPALAQWARPRVMRLGDGLATLLEKSDSLRMNRVIGLGHRGAAKEEMIDALVEFYRAARLKRFSFLLGPSPQAAEIGRWLDKRGFTRRGGYRLLLRECSVPIPRIPSKVTVTRAGRAQWGALVRVQSEVFAVPASRRDWSMAAAAAGENECFLAFLGATTVGAGILRSDAGLAWLGGGATRTRWRRRGVQTALIGARLRRAARLGCQWAWAETLEPRAGRPNGSRRNLIRLGFEEVCTEPSFVWQER